MKRKPNKIRSICIILLSTGLIISAIFVIDGLSRRKANLGDHIVDINNCRHDIEPLVKILPDLGSIDECYWDTGILNNLSFLESILNIGPSQYWYNGYLKISKDNLDKLKEKYVWEKYYNLDDEQFNNIINQLNDGDDNNWFVSDELNKGFGPGFAGVIYVNFDDAIIIFNIVQD